MGLSGMFAHRAKRDTRQAHLASLPLNPLAPSARDLGQAAAPSVRTSERERVVEASVLEVQPTSHDEQATQAEKRSAETEVDHCLARRPRVLA